MSRSSPPRDRPSIPSPRPLQAQPGNSSSTASSRPGTASASGAESLNAYTLGPPSSINDPFARQHGFSQHPAESSSQPPPRGFGVHSILNPHPESDQPAAPSATQFSAPASGQTRLPQPIVSPRSRKRNDPTSPLRTQPGSTVPGARRVLTPRSPGIRAASLGRPRNATFHGTGPALQPFTAPGPRIYTAEPGSADIPSLPPLVANTRTTLPGINAPEIWSNHPRTPALAGPPFVGPSIGTTQTASPSTSHTSRSLTGSTSPAFRYGQVPVGALAGMRQHGMTPSYAPDSAARSLAQSHQAGQPAYQMTLETDQGTMVVPVELDVQQASKVADEKRKRNAGASARFRQRRKEKEKEASTTISGLQQELHEMQEERDFYRNERNWIRDFTTRQFGIQLPPRPPSPQFHRLTAPSSHRGSRSLEDVGRARSDSAPAAQRRRTGEYQPQFAGSTHQSPIQQPFGISYGAPPSIPLPPPPTPQAVGHGPYASPRSLPPGPPAPPPAGLRAQSSYDPFRRDPIDRSWPPAR